MISSSEKHSNVHQVTPTRSAVAETDRAAAVAVLPIGSFEQHGSHLPMATDSLVAGMIAARLADDYGLLLLPTVPLGCSHEHELMPNMFGAVSISATTLTAVVMDVRESLTRSGITGLVIVNGHGGNYVLHNVVQQANVHGPRVVLFPGRADWQTARETAGMVGTTTSDMHGGELETSMLLHAHPGLVGEDYAAADHDAPHRPLLLTVGMPRYTESGIIGNPSDATPDKGQAVLDSLSASFAPHLAVLGSPPPPRHGQ